MLPALHEATFGQMTRRVIGVLKTGESKRETALRISGPNIVSFIARVMTFVLNREERHEV